MISTNTHSTMAADGSGVDCGTGISAESSAIGKRSGIILFIFSLAFRMIYVIQSTANPLFGAPVVDAFSYVKLADQMVDGIWLWDSVGNYLPIYPAFLAVQQILFGPNPIVNTILQSIMGAGTAVMLAQVSARIWNRHVGLICGYLIATARYLSHSDDAKIFWRYVEIEFDEFKFFSLQAKFLNGSLSEKEFRLRVGDSPDWKVSAEYVIGLNHWLNGDPASAVQAFERCLQVDSKRKYRNRFSPQKWAQEDLERIQDANLKSQTPVME